MAVFDIFDLRTVCHVQERRSHSRQCYQREGVFQIMASTFKRSLAPLSCQRVAGGRLMLMILVLLTSPESLFCTMHKVKKLSRCRDPVRASILWILEFWHRFHLPLAFGIRRIMAYRRHIFIHLLVAQAFSKSTHKFLLGWDHISCLGLSFLQEKSHKFKGLDVHAFTKESLYGCHGAHVTRSASKVGGHIPKF